MNFDYICFPKDHTELKNYQNTSTVYRTYTNPFTFNIYLSGIFQLKVKPGNTLVISDTFFRKATISLYDYQSAPKFFYNTVDGRKYATPLSPSLYQWFNDSENTYRFDGKEWEHKSGPSITAEQVFLNNFNSQENQPSKLSLEEQRKKEGKCIKCGGDTEFINLALVCKICGALS